MIDSKAMEPSQKQPHWEILSGPVLAWVKKNPAKSNIIYYRLTMIHKKENDNNQQNNGQQVTGKTTQKTSNSRLTIKNELQITDVKK